MEYIVGQLLKLPKRYWRARHSNGRTTPGLFPPCCRFSGYGHISSILASGILHYPTLQVTDKPPDQSGRCAGEGRAGGARTLVKPCVCYLTLAVSQWLEWLSVCLLPSVVNSVKKWCRYSFGSVCSWYSLLVLCAFKDTQQLQFKAG